MGGEEKKNKREIVVVKEDGKGKGQNQMGMCELVVTVILERREGGCREVVAEGGERQVELGRGKHEMMVAGKEGKGIRLLELSFGHLHPALLPSAVIHNG
ncbi:hypothetical protein ACH5RR_013418 [Cinchona calisaya]|uniref:Uncharacterized protein n=1 Tax=Cinchona calisaya TaxID=153742 RepID=A0ABD2ZZZ7_9GENT